MSHIKIEDSLFSDQRFLNLIAELGNSHMALGMIVSTFKLAQKHWPAQIPTNNWPQEFNPIIKVGLAIVFPDSIYVCGSRDQIEGATQTPAKKKLKLLLDGPNFEAFKAFDQLNPEGLLELWNTTKSEKQKGALKLPPDRFRKVKQRLKENPQRDFWIDVVGKIAASPFCNGENERGWLADFDFLIRPGTGIKALEGKYDGPQNKKDGGGGFFSDSETIEQLGGSVW